MDWKFVEVAVKWELTNAFRAVSSTQRSAFFVIFVKKKKNPFIQYTGVQAQHVGRRTEEDGRGTKRIAPSPHYRHYRDSDSHASCFGWLSLITPPDFPTIPLPRRASTVGVSAVFGKYATPIDGQDGNPTKRELRLSAPCAPS